MDWELARTTLNRWRNEEGKRAPQLGYARRAVGDGFAVYPLIGFSQQATGFTVYAWKPGMTPLNVGRLTWDRTAHVWLAELEGGTVTKNYGRVDVWDVAEALVRDNGIFNTPKGA